MRALALSSLSAHLCFGKSTLFHQLLNNSSALIMYSNDAAMHHTASTVAITPTAAQLALYEPDYVNYSNYTKCSKHCAHTCSTIACASTQTRDAAWAHPSGSLPHSGSTATADAAAALTPPPPLASRGDTALCVVSM
jgi:hypothetical protein